MKRISLKVKLSLWFTLILTIVCAVMLVLLFRIYQTTEKKLLLRTLEDTTDTMVSKIRSDRKFRKDMEDGKTDDHVFLVDEVQLMVYNEKGEHIAGVFLYPELDDLPVYKSSEPVRTMLDGRDHYYVDKKTRTVRGNDLYVRGIITAEDDLFGSLTSHSTLLIAFPILLALAFGGGYLMTGSSLKPVRDIRNTAEDIRASGDLSKRIGTSGNGDELDELANTINALFDKLDKDFDAQKQFTSNASHELRTPVSVILAQCEYGFDHADSAEELLQVVSSVQEQGYKMSGLIKLLLMFTRIEQGTEHYPKVETDLTELVHSVCEDMRIIAEKNITVTEELAPVTAFVNSEMLTLLTVNLIQNSLRYGKENGSVKVSLSENGDMAVLTVEDDGIGISAEDLPHIWERFYRSDRSRSSKGLGLGLALVKQIAEFHGGTAEAESTEGEGSRFIVKIIKQ
ncbi:cell wall metabolism sensor histidine kinase WalK [uncultured Ruminococcus sp.]|uniref:sensor histidine kinase n=1 Tax=uncultured Ruminococcus sp. TaxID=165186 RepID=UPI0025DD0C55|nr:HAMP domain-containing sensor histidine kinase [uncultured Ruminococcus sp.]